MKQYQVSAVEKKFIGSHILVAILALAVGSLFGPCKPSNMPAGTSTSTSNR
jgi:hypothetical protein